MILATLEFLSYIIAGVAIFLSLFYLYAKYKLSYWSRKGVKSPPAHILFGNLKDIVLLRRPPGEVLQDIYNSVNPDEPFVGCYLFYKPLLIIRDRELLKQMIIRDFEAFPNRGFGGYLETDPLGYVNLLTIRKPRWKYLRTKMTPCLTGQKLRNMFPLIVECSDKLMEFIDNEKADSKNVKFFELKDTVGRYCTDVFASTAFGITTNSFDRKNAEFFNAGKKVLAGWKRGAILLTNFFLPELIWFTALISRGPGKVFRGIFWDSYNARERVGNKRGDLIDSMIVLRNGAQNPEFIFDGDHLVSQALSFYIAGYEATSTAIAFALYDLSHNPEYEIEAYNEVMKVGTDELTMEKLSELTFLEKCINESLRLHPPLPMNDRICSRDYKIPGTDIILEKGTTVYVASLATNKDPRFFEDPDKYNPLRTDSDRLGFSAAHMSFGIGPRSCIGQRYGFVICKVALFMILKKYTLISETSEDRELRGGTIFTTTVHGIPLCMRERV